MVLITLVVVGELARPVLPNLSLEINEVKNWESPHTTPKDLYLLDPHQCHIPNSKVSG